MPLRIRPRVFFICVLIYVDDLIMGLDPIVILSSKRHFSSYFHMKDLDTLKYFLVVEVAQNSTCIYFCWQRYALDVLVVAGLLSAKPMDFSIKQHHTSQKARGLFLSSPNSYRSLIGRFIYLTITLPDLVYFVHTPYIGLVYAQTSSGPLGCSYSCSLLSQRFP